MFLGGQSTWLTDPTRLVLIGVLLVFLACPREGVTGTDGDNRPWILVDNFESGMDLWGWSNIDAQNDTDPHIPDPQVAEVRVDPDTGNRFMIRKPAADGVVGNRKAIGYLPLPTPVGIGETYTFFTRVNVEYFPNNQSFGLVNVGATEISRENYDSFGPMIRITDKHESDGSKNDGTLMVSSGYKSYRKVVDPGTGKPANPMQPGVWYALWYVVNNARLDAGGQRYDLYIEGGEFETQRLAFKGAKFRMQRELPLTAFMTICNTGPVDAPYGNGGVRYDDIYMIEGRQLTLPDEAIDSAPEGLQSK